ncbi:MAG: tRNA uracil 4-sulfurtransferase ThiI [Mahellales bacterium]
MEKLILVRYGEIHLKGLNRPFFEKKLVDNIKTVLGSSDGIEVTRAQGRIFVSGIDNIDRALDSLSRVFGIVSVSPVFVTEKNMDDILRTCVEVFKNSMDGSIKTFKVEARRADKNFPLKSPQISRESGAAVLRNIPGIKVDVHNPDKTLHVEVRDKAYIYTDVYPGPGGMPVGANGKVVLLLSGGIDSPVAGWMVAKRGVKPEAVHFHSFPFTSERAKEKVIDLCRILTGYIGDMNLHIVPFTAIQQEIYEKCPDSQITVLMRRAMMKIAEQIALDTGAGALVTGESIGQVASQTIESLHVTNSAVNIPVLRPLIGFDKVEIMDRAKDIGTYQTSILPYEDCCTVFVPKHPVTKPKLEHIENSEKGLDIDKLIKEAIQGKELMVIKPRD